MEKQVTKKKSTAKRNGLIAAAVVAALLVVIVILGLVMFFQSPEKKIADGLARLVTAKSIGVEGTISTTGASNTLTATIDGETDKKVGKADIGFEYTMSEDSKIDGKLETRIDQDGILYAKLDNAKKFMEEYSDTFLSDMLDRVGGGTLSAEQKQQYFAPMRENVVQIGEKLDGQWLKVTESDIRSFNESEEAGSDCYIAFSQKLQSDASARNNLASAYQKYRFISIDSSLEDDEYGQGYTVSLDQAKLKDFKDAVADNAAVKELGSCGLDILTLGANDDLSDQSIDIWLNGLSSEITRIRYTKPGSSDTTTVDMKLSYDMDVKVETPENAASLSTVLPSVLPTAQ